ncbi:LacI family DNA-binding transcriptional regulator [Qipengyuania sp. 1XM1-15A]|uniref:LacI family DNA-binding transcriptional regulator n=1 Tax=Qipengyuania xiamenensis TaxID=2867237 RepID=UPI001C88A0E5|nr:LacI family DNA-binding transcriptional regulator [Qipengyuania xiamenensis]MBX7532397.1 LacI family DNA-binding transcriptional regulator [Qipengyuania xiamenensis]
MGRRRQSVTIKHVAADAGVSLQTVSRVINNEPNVRPAMKERVQASIDKLGYVPSIAAQRMSGSRSYLILAINDRDLTIADWKAREGRDWVDQMLLGGMLTCAEHGYRMLIELVDTHSDHVERELSAAIAALQPDGVILTPPHSENALITGLLAEKGIPFARIGSKQEGPGIAMTMGDSHNARLATDHLIELGHERIGFIAGPEDFSLSGWRMEGWASALDDAGFSSEGLCERGDFGFESGAKAAERLLDRDPAPTAIIASSDQMALAVLEVARRRGLNVPKDLSLVSFDNSPIVRFTQPPLTAIDQPIAATAARAVELLIDARKKPAPIKPVQIQGELVVRGSTASARVDAGN